MALPLLAPLFSLGAAAAGSLVKGAMDGRFTSYQPSALPYDIYASDPSARAADAAYGRASRMGQPDYTGRVGGSYFMPNASLPGGDENWQGLPLAPAGPGRRAPGADTGYATGAEGYTSALQSSLIDQLRARSMGLGLETPAAFDDQQRRLQALIASRVAGSRSAAARQQASWEQSNAPQAMLRDRMMAAEQEQRQAQDQYGALLSAARQQDAAGFGTELDRLAMQRAQRAQALAAQLRTEQQGQAFRQFQGRSDIERQKLAMGSK